MHGVGVPCIRCGPAGEQAGPVTFACAGRQFPCWGREGGVSPLGREHTSPRAEEGNAGDQPERGGHSPWNVSLAVFAGTRKPPAHTA